MCTIHKCIQRNYICAYHYLTHTHMYTHAHTMHMHTHMHTHAHMHTQCTCIHTCTHAHTMHMHTHMHTYTHNTHTSYMHTCIHTCIHTCMHTYTHIHTHTHFAHAPHTPTAELPVVSLSGNRAGVHVTISIPTFLHKQLPEAVFSAEGISVCPVLFNTCKDWGGVL